MTGTAMERRPLYQQVYDFVAQQLIAGAWRPGEPLPSEQALADQLRVSQGTVRKALDILAAEQQLERRQGKGTFVSLQTPESSLFRFFRLGRAGSGERGDPMSKVLTVTVRKTKAHEKDILQCPHALEIERVRCVDTVPVINEVIVLDAKRFQGLAQMKQLPNTLYALYQRTYNVNVVSADESLHADYATAEDAARLGIDEGAPVLQIVRVAKTLDDTPVELRTSRCDTRRFRYMITLR